MATNACKTRKATSEERRRQNRRAQKTYRDRQKRQLETLKNIVEARQVLSAFPGCDATLDFACTNTPLNGAPDGNDLRPEGQHTGLGKLELQTGRNGDACTTSATVEPQVLVESENLPNPKLDDELLRFSNMYGLSLSQRALLNNLTLREILLAGLSALCKQPDGQSSPSSSDPDQASPNPHTLRTDRILILLNVEPCLFYTPDPYSNHLRLKPINAIAAIRANASILSISFPEMMDAKTESPIHASTILNTTLATLCTSPYLRPTPAQYAFPHHPYLDALPFPSFRQIGITALAAEPPLFDEDELCADFESGGLICWGSSLGGERGVHGSGTPWDIRSWEARPWFLEKWGWVFGGETGELWGQSRWWWRMRGMEGEGW